MKVLKQIADYLKNNDNFLIISHEHPDGDNIGSQIALALFLKSINKNFYIYNQDPVPEMLSFLPGTNLIKTAPPPTYFKTENILLIDTGDFNRTGSVKENLPLKNTCKLINIDHHPGNRLKKDAIVYVDTKSSSTGEIIYKLLKEVKAEITKPIAMSLYTAIITDTGNFKQANTTADSLITAGKLIKEGQINTSEIISKIYNTFDLRALKLTSFMLAKIKTRLNGRIAYSYLTQDMFDKSGSTDEHTEGLINYIRSLKGVEISVLFREMKDNKTKVNFRTKANLNILPVATIFGGGGHPNAAGALVNGSLKYVKAKVLKELEKTYGK